MGEQILNGVIMTVRKSPAVLVSPESETPNGFYYLSSLDQAIPFTIKTIYTYKKSDENLAEILMEALAKVLVQYYPLTGSLVLRPDGEFIVELTKKGVPFVEAVANCTMDVIGDIRVPDPDTTEKLIYTDPSAKTIFDAPLLTAQVTKFKCGGFTLGIGVNHSMVDGVSGMNFINSWAETANSKPISAIPFHDRTLLRMRMPPQITYPYDDVIDVTDSSDMESYYQKEAIINRSFHFDTEKLAKIKDMALADGTLKNCSMFAALSAFIWRARSKAFNMKPHQLTKLRIMVDFRQKLKGLPEGYFGNGVTTIGCICSNGELTERPMSFAVEKIKNALGMVTEEYVRSKIDFMGVYKPQLTSVGTLVISSWTRLAYGCSNFGWGDPTNFGCGDLARELCVFFNEGEDKNKKMVVVLALPESIMANLEKVIHEACK
ncbi:hypothetical protein MLD38_009069 [Melastoma candidum]|uniref:Uncharacterized protein n=1 Tax=Melastoma candidum TaxID=119954 RepID=A0ACB9RW25_9MYRT|nr:hypothetical protein MLD38_009069 [Melastoma candidum]